MQDKNESVEQLIKGTVEQGVVEAIGDAVSIQNTDFKILYQNQAHKDIIGDHLGDYCYRAYEKRDRVCKGCPLVKTFESGGVYTKERSAPTDRGTIHVEITSSPLRDKTGKIIAGIEVVRDITERKKAEDLLRKSQNELRLMYDAITDFITVISPDYRILSANRVVKNQYGQDLCGKVCYEVYQARNETCPDCPTKKAIETKKPAFSFQPATEVSPAVEIHAFPILDEEGEVIAIVENGKDITERKKVEKEKEKLEAQLLHAQKMEAVGQLAGGVAHDFNNILTAIIGHGNLMQMKMKKDDPLRMNIDQILSASNRGAHLTQSLLAFSRKQIINPQPIDLNEVVTRVEKLLLRVIREDINLETVLIDEDLTVMADSGHIEQVLMNLATNARDSMPEGGILSIETGLVEIDDEFIKTHGYGKQGKHAILSVTDSGEGMDKETRQKIFEPFFTTKEVGKGTGLGLSMVYGIIKQHDGFIDLYSEPGKGTKFSIYLSVVKTGVEEEEITEPSSVQGGTETVLVAEDDEAVRGLSRDILERFGYTVIEAEDGEDAIHRFMENKDKINLLLLDVIMPKRNGKEVYEQIKGIKPDVKTLFLSGYSEDLLQKKGVLEKGLTLIFKPVAVIDLLRKVREVLDE